MTERWLDGIRRHLRNLHNALTGIAERLIQARQTAAGGQSPDGARTPLEAYTDELATYAASLRCAPVEQLAAVLDWYATEVALARDSVNEAQARRWRLTRTTYEPETARG